MRCSVVRDRALVFQFSGSDASLTFHASTSVHDGAEPTLALQPGEALWSLHGFLLRASAAGRPMRSRNHFWVDVTRSRPALEFFGWSARPLS